MKIFIGIPTSGAPTPPFLESLARLVIPAGASIEHYIVQGNYIPAQRELIAERAMSQHADILIMCDDDMVLPPHAMTSLTSILENDSACGIAGALYYSRDGFRPMTVDDWEPGNTTTAIIPAFDTKPVRVGGVGFGCVAIRMSLLTGMPRPWFPAHVYLEPAHARVRVCNEDYLFCAAVRSARYDVILHPGVRCGHYDRLTGQTVPATWEPAEVTSQRRVAVIENGVPALVPFRDLAARREQHEVARLTYIRPCD